MGKLVDITARRIVDNRWVMVDDEPLPAGDIIVGLARWRLECDALRAREGRVGVRVTGGDDLSTLIPDLGAVPLVAIEFPKYADGRGYSLARLLRRVYGYRGELRAVGDVRRDEADLMRRVGFDTLEPADGQDPEAVLTAFGEIEPYPGQP